MKLIPFMLALFVLLPANSLLADADESPPLLKHNPFSRPPSKVLQRAPTDSRRDDGTILLPELQATMVSSANRLANVGGRILKRGDAVQGYELIAIDEQFAVFRRNGEDITVYVKPLAEDDE